MKITRALFAAGLGVASIAAVVPAPASAASLGKVPVVAVANAPAAGAEPAGLHVGARFVSFVDAEPGIAQPGADETAVYLDSDGNVIPIDPQPASESTLIGCTPENMPDNPHWSSPDVSGHGAWKKGNCNNDRANVYNCLYEWYTDNTWRQKACSSVRELRPYTGGAERTVARRTCNDRNWTSWRNHIDVDVIGEVDTGEQPYKQANVDCRVY
ncbi:hypothetical protein ABT336_19095 [Micromonospora sp. NPDC000207]|uniref:hypothetical protein n=1 Tax=Micromonospora sp. NPDC000207 TaxID=3154246 RepID=UPI00332FB9BD